MMQDRPAPKAQKSADCDQNMACPSPDTALFEGIAARLARPVVLIGMMGAGKSELGAVLAASLSLPFADSDAAFVAKAGCSIADYFARHGEAAFREAEMRVMDTLLDGTPRIIAAGGGIVTLPETRAMLQNRAWTIWLQAEPETLAARCAGDTARPLLQGGDPVTILRDLLTRRAPLYQEAAHMQVSTDGADGKDALTHIAKGLNACLG